MAVVTFVLGLLVVIQLRSQAGGQPFESLSSQDLTTVIANLNGRNTQLRSEVGQLEGQLRDLRQATTRGETSVTELGDELRRIRRWAGLEPVQGRGVRVLVGGTVTADAINDILNELRNGGAEALAIEAQRIVPGSVVSGDPGRLSLGSDLLPHPFTITAIGNPSNLSAILIRPGGLISRIQAALPEASVSVVPVANSLELPATTRDLQPRQAGPAL